MKNMKNTEKKSMTAARFLTCLAACLFCVFIAVPAGAKAETKRVKNIKALVANMEGYERELLIGIDLEIGENRKLSLKAATKAKAAVLASANKINKVTAIDDFYERWTMDLKTARKVSTNLFGKAYTVKYLPKEPLENDITQVYTKNNKIYKKVFLMETDTDFEVRNITVSKNTVTRDIYCGYWGCNDGTSANFRITYTVKKNAASDYGYVISSMKVDRLYDEWASSEE